MKKRYNHFRWLVGIGISVGLFGLTLWIGGTLGVQPVNAQAQPTPEPIIIYEGTVTETYMNDPEATGDCLRQWPAVLELLEDSTLRLVVTSLKLKMKISVDVYNPDSPHIITCETTDEVTSTTYTGTYTLNPNRLVINNCVSTEDMSGWNIQCSGEGIFTDTSAEGNIDVSLGTSIASSYTFTMEASVIPDAVIACTPTVRGLSPSQPGDVIQPGASYTGPDGQGVGIIQERWLLNGVNTTSIVWDGKQVQVELQYTCLDNSMGSRTYTIPAYQPPGEQPPVQPGEEPPVQPGEEPPVLPGEEPPAFPGDLSPQDIAKVAGAILIGLGGLIGVGGAAVGVGGAIIGAAPPAVPPAVPQPPASEPPGAPGGEPPPAASPGGGAPKGFFDGPLWELIKINTSAASTIIGSLSDLIKFPNGPDALKAIKTAGDAFRNNANLANTDRYRKALADGAKNTKLSKLSGALGWASKVVDVIDAVSNAQKKAADKGFTGLDKAATVISEVGKKGLGWMITGNPVIGLGDAVVGGVTQTILGKNKRIDVGAVIDKGGDGLEKVSTDLGTWMDRGGVTATAKTTTSTALNNARNHINNQVASGKLSPASGRARLSRLEKLITGEK